MAEQPTPQRPPEDPNKVSESPERPPEDAEKVPEVPKKPPLDPIEHDRRVRRFLLRLSLANWGVAILAWTISAFLGIASPASIFVYSVLFVIGLVAVIVALLTYVLEKFGHEPPAVAPGEPGGDEDDAEAVSAGDAPVPAAS
jgi:hypothetical protein